MPCNKRPGPKVKLQITAAAGVCLVVAVVQISGTTFDTSVKRTQGKIVADIFQLALMIHLVKELGLYQKPLRKAEKKW